MAFRVAFHRPVSALLRARPLHPPLAPLSARPFASPALLPTARAAARPHASTARRVGVALAVATTAALTAKAIHARVTDDVEEKSEFTKHTRTEMKSHPFSGMHQPFRTKNPELLALFDEHCSDHAHLLPTIDDLRKRQSLETPVRIRPLTESPAPFDAERSTTMGIGGPPALMSLTAYDKVTYLNDESGWSISTGSAYHIEEDRPTEEPSKLRPTTFMLAQLKRAIFEYKSFSDIERNGGHFPWRSLDWIAWMKRPEEWLAGAKLLIAVQLTVMQSAESRQSLVQEVIENCKFNERFYKDLNARLGDKLLLPGKGSIIIARIPEEVAELKTLERDLAADGQKLAFVSPEEYAATYGHAPKGLMFARKEHDRVLSPLFKKIITDDIVQKGGKVINGKVIQIFTDGKNAVVEYQTPDGTMHYLSSNKILMSLGKQKILDAKNKPLFDTVAARGISFLAFAFAPEGCTLPPASVYGDTNHIICLKGPMRVMHQGKTCNMFLVRATAGATVAPRDCGKDSPNYDGTIGLGLYTAMKNTLGETWELEPLIAAGCNRSISAHMYTHWATHGNIHVQYGAGGGGLTNGFLGAKEGSSSSRTPLIRR